jgi:NAD(P)-dependent dehydrogenase (short-subunit alcohol dehydrogenase family)
MSTITLNMKKGSILDQREIFEFSSKLSFNNVVTRNMQKSAINLLKFDASVPLSTIRFSAPCGQKIRCYGCNKAVRTSHSVYVFSCQMCGKLFQELRHLSRDLTASVAVVVGCRTKLGHQCMLKLLNAGATVVGTTRLPEKAVELFQAYDTDKMGWSQWTDRLIIYSESLDFDVPDIKLCVGRLHDFILSKFGRVDILVICAAQTIRCREKDVKSQAQAQSQDATQTSLSACVEEAQNRYGDKMHVTLPEGEKEKVHNSWCQELEDLEQTEMEEVFRINSVAPTLVVQALLPLLRESLKVPYIINTHAREGLLCVKKSSKHIHTNMAKAALAMLTRCLISCNYKTHSGDKFSIHGVDPGWISVDEYYEEKSPWIVPPLDEIDGAARILYPLFCFASSMYQTRRHFHRKCV